MGDELTHPYWRRNLAVCVVGSFTTLVSMTLLLPYLPVYVQQLGVHDDAAIARWSGFAYAATFLTAALTAPLWGTLSDRFGRKPMLVRASLGMAVATAALGLAQSAWQLVALRLLVGLLGGYSSASNVLVAAQTPKQHTAKALGILATGIMAGTVVGPLVGGVAPELLGPRPTFFAVAGLIFLAFCGTALLIREDRPARVAEGRSKPAEPQHARGLWAGIDAPGRVVALLATAGLVMFATVAIEPILTLYVGQLAPRWGAVSSTAGVVFAVTACGTIISAPRLGRLADRIGYVRVITGCLVTAAVLALVQAGVSDVIELGVARFAMGLALGGLLPCVTASLRHAVPDDRVGRVIGLSVTSQYAGQVAGPVLGGVVAAHLGVRAVFVLTAAMLLLGLVAVRGAPPRGRPPSSRPTTESARTTLPGRSAEAG